jgi:hypothetical protein
MTTSTTLRATILLLFVPYLALPTAASAVATVTPDKAAYLAYDPMTIVSTGISDPEIDGLAWVGLFPAANSSPGSYIRYEYLSYLADRSTWNTNAPQTYGNYQARVYTGANVLLATQSFTVGSNHALPGQVTISAPNFLVADPVRVIVTGLTTGQLEQERAWAGLFRASDLFSASPLSYAYLGDLDDRQTWDFAAPNQYGQYEVRVFTKDTSDETILQQALYETLPFQVISSTAKPGDLAVSAGLVQAGGSISALIGGLSQGQITNGAWLGLFLPSDAIGTSPLGYEYVRSLRDGRTWTFNAPTELGAYEIRAFTLDCTGQACADSLFGAVGFSVVPQGATDVKKLRVKPKRLKLKVGQIASLKVIAVPRKGKPFAANNIVTFQSLDTNVATVNVAGQVTAGAPGTTTVTVGYANSAKNIKVKVK